MAQNGEEMTEAEVRLMGRVKRSMDELVRIRTLCSELEEATDNIASEMFGTSEECGAQEQEGTHEIDMTKPQPCTVKFQDADAFDWTAKLIEETDEAVHEARIVRNLTRANDEKLNQHLQLARKRLAEELTDVIHVCVSWLDAEGWDEEARGELHRYVNEKNKDRGYF